MSIIKIKDKSWSDALDKEFEQAYYRNLQHFLDTEKTLGKSIFPPENQIFNAFELCPLSKLKVVIIGQDPYHDVGQAHGLAFSVNDGIAIPPSLQNIYKEIATDTHAPIPLSGNLERWALQGVLLLNAVLTVEAHRAGSHQGKGWEIFTDRIIKTISQSKTQVVFMLWGNYAKQKSKLIHSTKHFVLASGHPSPMSANRGLWFGNKHFLLCNEYLIKNNMKAIEW
jgi:uracil-DNA glycosylase